MEAILKNNRSGAPETVRHSSMDGKDELNLAEFPLCSLAHRLRPDQKTLHFTDHIWDEGRGETITRQLTVTGSDAYGLPTALDDEVLLGLIQLSRQGGFAERKVLFTRYQLIQLLGWREETKSYERLEASLNRWTGVTLYYRNAWWNKGRGCWLDEKFHVLDNVWLCHRTDPGPAGAGEEAGAPRSAFVWNEVIFRSFETGHLKTLDFDFYKALRSAIAKRLYRFLDKRFFHRHHLEFKLLEFAWEHAGLARGYDAAGLKRRLRPGIAELEQKGYLAPLPDDRRFPRRCACEWAVVFDRANPQAKPELQPGADTAGLGTLALALTERGVNPATARVTAHGFPAEEIRAQLEVFDWLVARQDPKVSRNPPGFLVRAIQGSYAPPRDFVRPAERAQQATAAAERQRRGEARSCQRSERAAAKEAEQQRVIAGFWQSLSAEARTGAEVEALAAASALQRTLMGQGGSAAVACRTALLDGYVLRRLGTGGPSPVGAVQRPRSRG